MASTAVNALRSECEMIEREIKELNEEYDGKEFPEEVMERWNRLNTTVDDYKKKIQMRVRQERVEDLSREESNLERVEPDFQISKPGSFKGDPYDLSTIERDSNDPEKEGKQLRDRAKYVIERSRFPQLPKEDGQTHAEGLLESIDTENGRLAQHMVLTGSPTYKRAFGKYLLGRTYLSPEESRSLEISRALSLTGTSGGFAVPFELDPTVIPTSNLAINPFRAISRVEQVTVDEWRGVSSGAITAAYAAEATAASDNSPTLAQPTISTEKAQAFIPFSIEIGMDWSGMQTEMARLLQDSKDVLEATKFATGNGTNEPFGVVTGATTVYTAAGTNTITIADIYGWEASLPARFRPRGSFVINAATVNRIRQFDTAGGAGIWLDNLTMGVLSTGVPIPGALQRTLLGHPAYEATGVSGTYTTGQLVGVFGDFSYYVIVDRIGMTIETIPMLFDVTNNMPTGQRGLYCYWRNGAKVVSAAAFSTLKLA